MQRFRVKMPMDKQGHVDLYIVTEIQDIINILKTYDSNPIVHASNIVFDGTFESLHLLQGSLLINGLDKKIKNSITVKVINDPYYIYISQIVY